MDSKVLRPISSVMALMRDLSMWVFAAIRGVAKVANAAPAARSSRLVMIMIVVDRMDWTNATGRKIVLEEGDITQIAVDAMANAANSALAGGGGVDGGLPPAGGRAGMRGLAANRAPGGGGGGWPHPPRGRTSDHAGTRRDPRPGGRMRHRQRGGDGRRRPAGEVRIPRGGAGVSRWPPRGSGVAGGVLPQVHGNGR